MLEIKSLSKSYKDLKALRNISFKVKKGEVVGFLGPNGAGKTTTMKIINGYIMSDNGDVSFDSISIKKNRSEFVQKIGYLPEGNPLYEDMKVDEHLIMMAEMKDIQGSEIRSEVRRVIDACNLGKVKGRIISTLSKGFKQRVGLAIALLGDPEILILDEPTSGLDPNQSEKTRNLISEIKKEKYILFSTHILTEVSHIADNVVIIDKGKVIATGTEKQLINRYLKTTRAAIVFSKASSRIETQLKKLKDVSVKKVTDDDGKYVVEVEYRSNYKIIAHIFEFAKKQKYEIEDVVISNNTLEDVFRKLTK